MVIKYGAEARSKRTETGPSANVGTGYDVAFAAGSDVSTFKSLVSFSIAPISMLSSLFQ